MAVLHFNENANRKQAVNKKGEERYDIIYPKYKKGGYIWVLQAAYFSYRYHYGDAEERDIHE